MKILKITMLIVWGFITFGFFILAFVHRQDAINYKSELDNQKIINSILENEYSRNIKAIKELYPDDVKIDSIIRNSKFINKSFK